MKRSLGIKQNRVFNLPIKTPAYWSHMILDTYRNYLIEWIKMTRLKWKCISRKILQI